MSAPLHGALLASVLLVGLLAGPSAPDAWAWPVSPPHQVLAPFQAPATSYAPGHRGIDLAAGPGTPVYAVADGVVSFAGVVVDRPVLSLRHAGDLISSVEPVIALVTVDDRVHRGQLLGTVGTGAHCSARCLHLGVRLHGRYVSPLLLLGGVPRAVLLPLE